MNLRKSLAKKLKKTGGFTLIEMLIVVAIIAILVAVSIPMVGASLDKARKATDDANERAAKTVAMLSAAEGTLNGDGATPITANGTKVYYYDIPNGKLTETEPVDSNGESNDNKDKLIEVTFAATTMEPNVGWK